MAAPLRGRALAAWAATFLSSDAVDSPAAWQQLADAVRAGLVVQLTAVCLAATRAADSQASPPALPLLVVDVLGCIQRASGGRPPSMESISTAAVAVVRRASLELHHDWFGLASSLLALLVSAAEAQASAWKTCALFVSSVLAPLVLARATLANQPAAAALVCDIDAALKAGLFPSGSFGSHQSAVTLAAKGLQPEQAVPPAKRQKTEVEDGSAAPLPPASALYSLVVKRCACGEAAFFALLPLLLSCYAAGCTAGQAVVPRDGFALVSLLLEAVGQAQATASSSHDVDAWCLAAAAGTQLIAQARLCNCCVVAEDPVVLPTLQAHAAASLAQAAGLASPSVAAVAAGLSDALLEVDIRLAQPEQVWTNLCAGYEAAPQAVPRFACAIVAAFGDTRRLPELLSATVVALLEHPAQHGCALLTLPLLSTAWRAAAAQLPPLQAPEVLRTVGTCISMAAAAWSSDPPPRECVACLAAVAETMTAVICGLQVIPASAPALASQCASLAQQTTGLLDLLPLNAHASPSLQSAAALLLRVCSAVASLAFACSACTSSLGECHVHAERCLAAPLGALGDLAVVLHSQHDLIPALKLAACACAVLLLTAADHCALPAPSVARDLLRETSLRHFQQTPSSAGSWDGVAATVSADTLLCAIWQLAAENMAVWAACLSADSLKPVLTMLVRSAAGQCEAMQAAPALITLRFCSCQLLEDADFFELRSVRAVLPDIFVSEVAVQRLALRAGQSPRIPKARRSEKTMMRPMKSPGRAAAGLAAMPLVALIGQIPSEYFCEAPALRGLHAELAAFEEEAFSLLVAQDSAEGCQNACVVLCAVRQTIARLLTLDVAEFWSSPARTSWLVESLERLAQLASSIADEAQPLWQAVLEAADATARLMEVVAKVATVDQAAAMVDAACHSSAEGLESMVSAHCGAALAAPAFVPRAVSQAAKGTRQFGGGRLLAPIMVKVVLLSSAMHATLVATTPRHRWDHVPAATLRAAAVLLSSASCVVQRSSLLQPFCAAAAAALQVAGKQVGVPELHRLALRAAHHASGLHDGHAAPLALAREATRLLVSRGALSPDGCMLLLSLYLVLLDAETTPPSLVVDAFATLATSQHSQQIADALLAAAQEIRSAGSALQLLLALLPVLPKALAACIAEQALSIALLYCGDVSSGVSGLLSARALDVLSVLMATRSTFPLRASSIAQALQAPALLFSASSPYAAGWLDAGRSQAFMGCCELLSTAMRSHPHELQRCMPLVTSSARALTAALLRGLADSGCSGPFPSLACATALGALFETAAGQGGAHGKYCAYLVADYLTALATLRLDVAAHPLAPQLAVGLHRLVDQCSAFELQQLHVTLSAGLGGVRQTSLAQLVEARDRSKYTGKV